MSAVAHNAAVNGISLDRQDAPYSRKRVIVILLVYSADVNSELYSLQARSTFEYHYS